MKSKFEDKSKDFLKKFQKAASENMHTMMLQYKLDLKDKLDLPPVRSGRIYYNVKGKEVHQASAPGQPPAPLSGDLIASVDHKVVEDSSKRWEGVTYSDLPYSYILELIGHPKGSPEEARPAWLDTLYEHMKDYEEIATEGFKRR